MILWDSEVLPWALPVTLGWPFKDLMKVALRLQDIGVESGVYHFDTNCNLLNPKFIECVLVPCHHQISDSKLAQIVEEIKRWL